MDSRRLRFAQALPVVLLASAMTVAFSLACVGGGGGGGAGVAGTGLSFGDLITAADMPSLDAQGKVVAWPVTRPSTPDAPMLATDATLTSGTTAGSGAGSGVGGKPLVTGNIPVKFTIADGTLFDQSSGTVSASALANSSISSTAAFYAFYSIDGVNWAKASAAQQSDQGVVNSAVRPTQSSSLYYMDAKITPEPKDPQKPNDPQKYKFNSYEFVWDSFADVSLKREESVFVALGAADIDGWDQSQSVAFYGPLIVDNTNGLGPLTGPEATFTSDWSKTPATGLSGTIPVNFRARHPTSAKITVLVLHSVNDGPYVACTASSTLMDPQLTTTQGQPTSIATNSTNGKLYVFWWDSSKNIVNKSESNVKLRLVAYDTQTVSGQEPTRTSAAFAVTNIVPPPPVSVNPPVVVLNGVSDTNTLAGQSTKYLGKTFTGNIIIDYTVVDQDVNDLHNALFEYKLSTSTQWVKCAAATGFTNTQKNVTANGGSANNSWTWDSATNIARADGKPELNVTLRVTVFDSPGGKNGVATSLTFNVYNPPSATPQQQQGCANGKATANTTLALVDTATGGTAGQIPAGANPPGPTVTLNPGGYVVLEVKATDPESDPVTAVFEYTLDGTTWLTATPHSSTPNSNVAITTSPGGTNTVWHWDAATDLAGDPNLSGSGTPVWVRVWPGDCSVTNPNINTDKVGNGPTSGWDQGPATIKDPNTAPTVVIDGMPAPGNTTRDPSEPMIGAVSPPFKVSTFPIPITYTVTDPDAGATFTLAATYQFNNNGTWSPATPGPCTEYTGTAITPASEGKGPLSPGQHTFIWDAGVEADISAWQNANPGQSLVALVTLTVTDDKNATGTSSNPQAPTAGTPDAIVNGNSRPTITITAPTNNPGPNTTTQYYSGDVTITYDVNDVDGDTIEARFEYWNGTAFMPCTLKTPTPGTLSAPNKVTGLTSGTGYTVVWATATDIPGDAFVFLQGTAKDAGGDGTPHQVPASTTSGFRINNTGAPPPPPPGGGGPTTGTGQPAAKPTPVAITGFGSPNVGTTPGAEKLRGICAGDWDGDGDDDLAIADTASSNVIILKSNGNGTFSLATSIGVGYTPTQMTTSPQMVATGDMNNDGWDDIVAVCSATGDATVLYNNGGNGTTITMTYIGPWLTMSTTDYNSGNYSPWDCVVGDTNADGARDIFTLNHTGTHNYVPCVSILVNQGGANIGLFYPSQNSDCQIAWPCSIGIGDFNGDGKDDVTVGNLPSASTNEIATMISTGTGTAAVVHRFDLGKVGGGAGGGNPFGMLLSQQCLGGGLFSLFTCFFTAFGGGGAGVFDHTSGDWDGDGDIDWAVPVSPAQPDNSKDGSFVIGENTGGGTIAPESSSSTPAVAANPFGIWSYDMNRDGKKDIAVTGQGKNMFSVMKNQATAGGLAGNNNSFAPLSSTRDYAAGFTASGGGPWFMTGGFFDNNGKYDLAATEFANGSGTNAYSVILGQ